MNSLEEQIKFFVNEIVNRSNNSDEIRKNVLTYKSFLINTKLITKNSEISKWLDVVINTAKLIEGIKESDGYVDIISFVEAMGVYHSKINEVKEDPKHYGHYHETSSSSCGSSSISNDSCGSEYERRRVISSSSCGGTYIVTSRC